MKPTKSKWDRDDRNENENDIDSSSSSSCRGGKKARLDNYSTIESLSSSTASATTAATLSTGRNEENNESDATNGFFTSAAEEPPLLFKSLINGCRSVDEYQRISFIDQGTYGMVFRAKCKSTGVIYALKKIKLGPEAKKTGFPITALREINILLALNHECILKVHEMVIGSSLSNIFMVMDFHDIDIKECIEVSKPKLPFSIAETKQIVCQLISAIEHVHSNWYLHRDLKTSNILYSNKKGSLCVCDFGMARKYGEPIVAYTNEVVTLWYRAPELLLGSKLYTTALDMWSVGCIFAELILGHPLLPGEGEVDQLNKVFRMLGTPTEEMWPGVSAMAHFSKLTWRTPSVGKLREEIPDNLSSFSSSVFLNDTGFDLLRRLLEMDPSKRISASAALQHPWISSEAPHPAAKDAMPRFYSKDAKPSGQE